MDESIKEIVKSARRARLMPPLVNSKTEERATSCLLASMMVVPEFAKSIISDIGGPAGKRARLECYTEVTFRSSDAAGEKQLRPDGLIVVRSGSSTWMALVESKVANNNLEIEQVESYIDLAKANGIDAVLTISNQFVTNQNYHPLKISKVKTRSTDLFHFSWRALLVKAIIVSHAREMEDPEQSFILDDLVNFLDHPSSGVSALTSLHEDWTKVCKLVQQSVPINKGSPQAINIVNTWQQLLRSSAIKLSKEVRKPVDIYLTSVQKKTPETFSNELLTGLTANNVLDCELTVPNAAARIRIVADLSRRNISISMRIDSPKDVKRATAAINWLTRQLKSIDNRGVEIRAHWPKRILMTSQPLSAVLESPESLLAPGTKELPRALEVVKVIDLAGRFKSRRAIVEDTGGELVQFYKQVGQHLSKWTPKAPRVREAIKPSPDIIEQEVLSNHTETSIQGGQEEVGSVIVGTTEPTQHQGQQTIGDDEQATTGVS